MVAVLTQSLIVGTALGLAKSSAPTRASNQLRRGRGSLIDGEPGAIPDRVRDPEVDARIEPAQQRDERLVALADLGLRCARRIRAWRASRRSVVPARAVHRHAERHRGAEGRDEDVAVPLRRAEAPEQREGEVVRRADRPSARRRSARAAGRRAAGSALPGSGSVLLEQAAARAIVTVASASERVRGNMDDLGLGFVPFTAKPAMTGARHPGKRRDG